MLSAISRPVLHRRPSVAAATAAAAALLLAGCGSGGGTPDKAGAAPASLKSLLPESMQTSGLLRIGADLSYAPVGFKGAGGKPDGLDVDLAQALGQVLGVQVQFVDVPFEKLLPGLEASQFDVVMSGMTDNAQRRDGSDDDGQKSGPGVDFVDYYITGSSIVVAQGNPQRISSLDDLCGRTVALQKGTVQAALAQRQNAACQKAHKQLTVRATATDDEALALVAQGKATADLSDSPVAALAAKQGRGGAQFQVTGEQLPAAPYGIAVPKADTVLRDALVRALDRVIRDGDYEKILAKWELLDGAAQNAVVNGGF
ncbi:ABC transporter substrate-binding protein [Streptomyces sp. TLI_171]|uniref:ABC transporter substrate-binding protein n=1 Tax=Streptomyces sp. TLI_171 TaxID=1938859 RepID=UPI000C18BB65|nr:ABC transporter substrate-binding protein [Streptomyces sp. TLI_171]RKE21091.1 polar amino acid transport system substrate-binding protein [Streptomyces sp. TLI_171]